MPKEQSPCVEIVGGVWNYRRTTMFMAMRALRHAHDFCTSRMPDGGPDDDIIVMVARPLMCVINNMQYLIDQDADRRTTPGTLT